MTHTAFQINPATATKARAERCARCNRALTRPGTVIPAVGVVGPECEQHVVGRLLVLQRAGLHALALTGEQRIPAQRNLDGTFTVPTDALSALNALANRVGVKLVGRFDAQTREYVLTLEARSLKAFLKRAEGVAA